MGFPGFSHLGQKQVQKDANLVDLEKSKMLQNEHLDAKIGVDTAENEPFKVLDNSSRSTYDGL